jgi:Fe-S cluster assembly protein SufD
MNACERLVKDYTQSKEDLPGCSLPWLTALRESAIDSFASQGLPDSKDENWKYTKINQLEQTDYALAQGSTISGIDALPAQVLASLHSLGEHSLGDNSLGGHCLVFVNGYYNERLSTLERLPDEIILCSFAHALGSHPEMIASVLGKIANYQDQAFTALNTALMSDGVFLWAPENIRIDAPIHCLFISTATSQPIISYPRLLLVLKDNAELTLVEHYIDVDETDSDAELTSGDAEKSKAKNKNKNNHNLVNTVTEIRLSPHAHLNHYKLQHGSIHSCHIAAMYVEQQQASNFTSHSYSLGAELARNDIQVRLTGINADCSLNGAYLVDGSQHVDYHTEIIHLAPGCNSQQVYKGVVQSHARAVFNGKVLIQPEAQQSNARQINKNLLLSENGEVDTKPELQIYADDVICSHGATVGQLDTLALFYLQSRGFSKKDAEAWLVYAFVSEVLEHITNPAMRKFILLPVIEQLNQLIGTASNLHQLVPTEDGDVLCH